MIPNPAQQTPFVDPDGFMVPAWRRWFDDLRARFGGSQDIKFFATDNTHLTFTYKGSDGVVRTGTVILS